MCPIGKHIFWVPFVCSYTTAVVSITACLSENFQFDIKSPTDFKIPSVRKLKKLFQKYKLQLTTVIHACIGHVLRKYICREFLKHSTTADSHENVIFFQSISWLFQLAYFVTNASELFWSWISINHIQVHKEKENFVIACLRPSQNVKLGIFTGSRAVNGKEMYKKAWCTCKVVVLPCFSSPPHLKLPRSSYYLRYIVIRQKQNILGANSIAPADSIPNVFSNHR